MPLPSAIQAALGRLLTQYNGRAYNAATNPGGFAADGHRVNFLPALQDTALVVQEAANAAASTLGAASTQASSTTGLTVGVGAKTLTVETGKNFVVGMPVRIAGPSGAPSLDGHVTAYDAATGTLTVDVLVAHGTGAGADWRVYLIGAIDTGPSPAGNGGKFRRLSLDESAEEWAAIDIGGGAGPLITASTALTAASAVVQPVNMAAGGQSVTLPDATGLTKGGRKFVIANKGARTFAVRAHGGGLLAVVPAGGVAEMHLDDNATAAGSWTVTGRGLDPALVLVDHTAPTTITAPVEVAVRLTDTLSLHFGAAAAGFAALAVDSTPANPQAGTWTAVEAAGAATVVHGFRIDDTRAIVFWVQGASHKAAVLTVDPATRAVSVGTAASTTVTWLGDVTVTGRPLIAQLTATLYVALYGNGANALAVSVSGSAVTLGTGVASGAVTAQRALAVYRVTDTTALALYVDDSGTAGSPYSIRGVVLTVDPATRAITVGASAGINDVLSNAGSMIVPTCQLSATSYVVGYYQASGTSVRAVVVTVAGTTVAFGGPLAVEVGDIGDMDYGALNANRFQPNLYRIDANRVLYTYGRVNSGVASRHVVLTEAGGVLTAGPILHGLWSQTGGGNFPQTPAGFLAVKSGVTSSAADAESAVHGIGINGTALAVTNTVARAEFGLSNQAGQRFGLSGGVCGIAQQTGQFFNSAHDGWSRLGVWHLFRNASGRAVYLGPFSPPDHSNATPLVPVEVAPSKAALIGYTRTRTDGASTRGVKLCIVEFPS